VSVTNEVAFIRASEGPTGLAVDCVGGFWVIDRVSGHLLRVYEGKVVLDLDQAEELVEPVAIAVTGDPREQRLAVLDVGLSKPRVLQFTDDGRNVSTTELPGGWMGMVQNLGLNEDGMFELSVVAGEDLGQYRVLASGAYVHSSVFPYWGPDEGPNSQPVVSNFAKDELHTPPREIGDFCLRSFERESEPSQGNEQPIEGVKNEIPSRY